MRSEAARYSREMSRMSPKGRALSKAILGWRLTDVKGADGKLKVLKCSAVATITRAFNGRKTMSTGKGKGIWMSEEGE